MGIKIPLGLIFTDVCHARTLRKAPRASATAFPWWAELHEREKYFRIYKNHPKWLILKLTKSFYKIQQKKKKEIKMCYRKNNIIHYTIIQHFVPCLLPLVTAMWKAVIPATLVADISAPCSSSSLAQCEWSLWEAYMSAVFPI